MSAAEYALRLANGEPLEAVLHEVWTHGHVAGYEECEGVADVTESPFTGETASE